MAFKYLTPLCLLTILSGCQNMTAPQGDFKQLNADANLKPLTLRLDAGKLSAYTGCNNAMGSYSVDKGELVVSQLASTMKACMPAAMERERSFSQFLQSRPALTMDGNTLTLRKENVVYQFELQPDLSNAETRLLYIAPERKTCSGVGKMECLQVRENPTDNWQLHYGEIEGFTPQPGVAYRVRVKEVKVDNPPADASAKRWVLDMVIEQHLVTE